MLNIRLANVDEYENVRAFYHELIDDLVKEEFGAGWKKDIYPAPEFLQESIAAQELYLAEMDGQIISVMVVNHKYNEGYKEVKWSIDVADEELLVIHALGVSVKYAGRGIAKQMVQTVFDLAKENEIKTVRLDVLDGNLPALKCYTKMGFTYVDTLQMFYEDTGWTKYEVFEYIVE